MGIDIRSMRSLVSVVSAGSISAAAERLYIAQPALSLQIKNIEEELGVKLLERTPKGVRLTDAGTRFLEHSSHLLRQFDMACDDVRSGATSPQGTVVLSMSQSIAQQLVLPLVRETLARWPKVMLSITEQSTGYISSSVLSGHVDMGFVFQAESNPALRFEHLIDEELVVVARPDYIKPFRRGRTANLAEIKMTDLLQMPFILPSKGHGLRNLLDQYLGVDRPLRVAAEVNTIPQLTELAAAGVGWTVLSLASVSAALSTDTLSAARIKGLRMERPVLLVTSAGRPFSAASTVVYQQIRPLIAELVSRGTWPAKIINN